MVPLKKKVGSEERKKRKRREMNTEEKEKDGWNERTISFLKKLNFIKFH